MSLTYTNTYAHWNNEVWYRDPNTGSCQLRYYPQTYGDGNIQSVRPETQHRSKPSPLWAHPTPLGRYYTFRVKTATLEQYQSSPYCAGKQDRYENHAYFGYYPPYSTFPDVNWTLDLALKAKNLRLNLASDIAEMRETVKGVSDATKGLIQLTKNIRRCIRGRGCSKLVKTFEQAKRTPLKTLSDTYLGINFGLYPTLGTVDNLVQALNSRLIARSIRHIVRFGGSKSKTYDYFDGYAQWTGKCNHRVSGKAYVTLEPRAYHITTGNVAEGLWELVPFSWALDYVFNIGDNLSALDAYRGISSVVGYATHRYNSRFEGEIKVSPWTCKEPSLCTYKGYERETFVGSPPPVKYSVSYEPHKSVSAMTNLLAVLGQMVGRRTT